MLVEGLLCAAPHFGAEDFHLLLSVIVLSVVLHLGQLEPFTQGKVCFQHLYELRMIHGTKVTHTLCPHCDRIALGEAEKVGPAHDLALGQWISQDHVVHQSHGQTVAEQMQRRAFAVLPHHSSIGHVHIPLTFLQETLKVRGRHAAEEGQLIHLHRPQTSEPRHQGWDLLGEALQNVDEIGVLDLSDRAEVLHNDVVWCQRHQSKDQIGIDNVPFA
mmetsp:Transcript_16791/g.27823  ORF Transcript_16791/g.27823 Transcript_16791/m.27823 type:complete len:216 (-) Transcript_16791:312-959(-)